MARLDGSLRRPFCAYQILCLVIISERETHVPIPNTLVKPPTANGSAVYCGVRVGRRQAFSFLYLSKRSKNYLALD